MFAKPYKLKSNTTLKNSEKKYLAQRIHDEFPSATEERVKELVSVKSTCICMKLVLHSGETVNVYAVDGVPVIIEREEGLLPTVCALWKVPELVPTLTIHSPVLPKLQGGAPLYLPGVAGGAGGAVFPRGAALAARTQDNAAPAAVGRAARSSGDMLLGAAGTCLDILHVYGDLLCKDAKFNRIERPDLGPVAAHEHSAVADNLAADVGQLNIRPTIKEEWPSLGKREPRPAPALMPVAPAPVAPAPVSPAPAAPALVRNEPRVIEEAAPPAAVAEGDSPSYGKIEDSALTECSEVIAEIPSDMDGLLQWCLLGFLRLEGRSVELPLKTNLLYRNHMFPLCPPDRTLDVKKSTYKKMSKFLEAMQQEGLVEVRELEKGVDAVVAINAAHPRVRAHARASAGAPAAPRAPPPTNSDEYVPPQVREVYCITAAVLELFAPLKKGAAVAAAQVRGAVEAHVRARGLRCAAAPRAVALDGALARILRRQEQESITWEELMCGVQSRMTASTEMVFAGGARSLTRARLDPVRMLVASRSGNKKVTLVSNLEAFGFNLLALSHVCQRGVAASCGVTRSPGAKADQLMLQGDQTHFVAKLLIEKYGLPKKFVEGADKALKKKK